MKTGTYLQMINYRINCKINYKINKSLFEKGFSLIEIMVSLALVGIVLFSVNLTVSNNQDKILEVADDIERSIRFGMHESVLRGSVVRLHLYLDKSPQEWAIEFGTDRDFVMPLFMVPGNEDALGGTNVSGAGTTAGVGGGGSKSGSGSLSTLQSPSIAEKEARDKLLKEVNQKFQRITDYQAENIVIPSAIKVIGVASNLQTGLVKEGEGFVYIYPNGEKDAALLILASDDEILTIKIDPYSDKMDRAFKEIKIENEDMLLDEQDKLAKEIYTAWVRE